ncbi:hydroxyisourate hydrolase [Streptomyces sp. CAU 1734]|uniref:hydroxyisourate hydrolase n=1 Tax=Streptomyces sp. CAU 1734 TaxID=3140360 RepID=UPI00326107AE
MSSAHERPETTAPASTAPAFSPSASSPSASSASVSTHVLDTGIGSPARGIAVTLSVRRGPDGGGWTELGGSVTDGDGRCADLPALPEGTDRVRLAFGTEAYHAAREPAGGPVPEPAGEASRAPGAPAPRAAFFPEVAVTFSVAPGEHHHVPLLLSPFGYSVYRGS